MSLILVVQPDASQTRVLQEVARTLGVELAVVDSTKRAVDAISRKVPDLILLSPILSPRDEDTLMTCLRSLDGASHLQTVAIPQFRGENTAAAKKSGFGFRKKKPVEVAVGADPKEFANEVAAHLSRAAEIRNRPPAAEPTKSVIESGVFSSSAFYAPNAPVAPDAPNAPRTMGTWHSEPQAPSYSWSDEDDIAASAIIDQSIAEEQPAAPPIINIEEPFVPAPVAAEPAKPAARAPSIADEISQLVRQLGLDVKLGEIDEDTPSSVSADQNDDVYDFGASLDRARNQNKLSDEPAVSVADAEAIRERAVAEARAVAEREARQASAAEIARVQAEAETIRDAAVAEARAAAEREAREAVAADLARVQIEAEQMREAAIAEARAAAEREAREAVAADLARVQSEAEQMRESAIAEAKAAAEREARATLAAEVERVRSEAQSTFTDALNKVKVEAEEAERRRMEEERAKMEQERAKVERANAEAQEAFARELARVRAEVEESLQAQLDAARSEAERIRAAEAEAARERATVESQLKAELDRLKFVTAQARKADESETKRASHQIKQLEAELATVRAKAEERKVDHLEELRAQMAEMREAAAHHARAAAAEAVAAEVARATAQAAATAHMTVAPQLAVGGGYARPTAVITQFPARDMPRFEPPHEEPAERNSRDYLSLWQPKAAPPPAEVPDTPEPEEDGESLLSTVASIDFKRHAKWALPVAACLLLVTGTGTAISTVANLVKSEEKPALTVQPIKDEPFIEVVEKRVGRIRIDSTPASAEAIINGKSYGRTPLTIPDLEAGLHTLVLKSSAGTITRKVTVKANQTTMVSEAVFSGWMAIFSAIPVKVIVDGRPVRLNDDSRVMTAPGKRTVEFVSEQFNYRVTETIDVRPGETTAFTLTLPMSKVRVSAPAGSEIRVDGQPAAGIPSEGLSVSIGAHEISAIHPERGERRVSVDVKHGRLNEVSLHYD